MSKYLWIVLVACTMAVGCKGAEPKVEPMGGNTREVSFKGYGGLELKGTFQLAMGSKLPAVLLLPGSGPTDRDGNQTGMQTDVLKQIAERLATDGVASLRFDKRAIAKQYAMSFPRDLVGLDNFFCWEAFVQDAEAGFSFLKAQPEIDPSRLAILGHSEGGIITAAMAGTSAPKALILVSTPGRNSGDVILEQISQGYSAKLTQPDALKKRVAETKRVVTAIRTTHKVPNDVPAELAPVFPAYLSRYLTSILSFEPASALASFKGPVLIVQGEKDIQVSPDRDAPKLKAAIQRSELFVVPGASHCLKAVSGEMDPGFEGPIKPEALDKISSWVKTNL